MIIILLIRSYSIPGKKKVGLDTHQVSEETNGWEILLIFCLGLELISTLLTRREDEWEDG